MITLCIIFHLPYADHSFDVVIVSYCVGENSAGTECATSLRKTYASDHAMNAVDEMYALNRDITRFFEETGAKTTVIRNGAS